MCKLLAIPGLVLCLVAGRLHGQLIDFESIDGEPPVDGMVISDQFADVFGVTFSLESGGAPVLARVGAPQTAFQGYQLLPDQPAPSSGTGEFFLTDDGVVGGPPAPVVITYASPVSAASGVVLDVDGAEGYCIEAYSVADALIGTVDILPNLVLDGSVTAWSLSFDEPSIARIVIRYTGSQTGGVGLAFDNFSPSTVASCLGDLDHDGMINGADLGLLLGAWGTNSVADLTMDGVVDGADLGVLLGAWGNCR